MSELPEGWTTCRLKDAIEDIQAGFASGKKDVKGGLSHLRMNNISVDGKLNLGLLRTVPRSLAGHNHYLKNGDVLICTTNSGKLVGKSALFDLDGDFAFSNHLTRLRVNPNALESKYLLHQLWLLWKNGDFDHKCKHWVNQSTLPKDELLSTDILLAPLNEQRRIVAKLEKLLSRVDAAQDRLATIPHILKRFRQSVLAAACSGRLTADWRAKHRNLEPYPVKAETDLEDDQACPRNWRGTRLGTLTALVTSGSRGWAKYYSDSGSIFIRAQNINSDLLNLEDIAFVKLPGRAEGLRTKVRQYDLLVTITGANVTKSALIDKPLENAYVSQHVALVRLLDLHLSKFLFYSVISPSHGRKQLQTAAYGQGKPGLNLENIRDVVVGLPPLPEQ